MDITVFSDLYVAGKTEDNEEFLAEVYYVMATNARGERWVHELTFPSCRKHVDDEGLPHFEDIRPLAEARAEDLASRVRKALAAGGQINFDYWVETFPAYGSEAFSNEEMIAWEREHA